MIINGKEYKIPEIDYNTSCQLEEYGFSIFLGMGQQKPATIVRAFTALCVGDLEQAGKEIEEHIINYGDITPIWQEIAEAVQNSRFFQKLVAKQKALEAKPKKKPQNTEAGEK